MPELRRILLIVAGSVLMTAASNAQDLVLKTNPFLKPVSPDTGQTAGKQDDDKRVAEMELRATMVAGEHSQANIGGVVIGLGEEINGYQLIEVHPRHVVVDRDGTAKEIRIANSDQGNRN